MKKMSLPLFAGCVCAAAALARPANYDESKIAPYTLPVQGFRFNDDSSVSALISSGSNSA